MVRLEGETSNTVTQATEEVVGQSGRPIGALSDVKKRREINNSGCISLRELQLVRAPGLEPGRSRIEGF